MRASLRALAAAAMVLPVLAPAVAGQAVPADGAGARARLGALVAPVQDADYRGDLGRLRSLVAEMEPFTRDPSLAGAARYWRGFAHWRHALNSLNDGAPPDSVDADFAAAIIEFREALRIDPSDVESQIGLAAGLGNRAFFNMGRAEGAGFMAEYVPLLNAIRRRAPDNPRMMFVAAASLFWAPADRGGDRDAALSMLERGIRLAESSPANADPLVASWGEAELHMLLAWFSVNLAPPQSARALRHAEAALALRPHWRYVRDILIPQVRQRGGPEGGRTMSSALRDRVAVRRVERHQARIRSQPRCRRF
jgi:tetratricopeptide (TPR) repeat protein